MTQYVVVAAIAAPVGYLVWKFFLVPLGWAIQAGIFAHNRT